ncbi:hypothetical protein [Desulfonatronovibrio magnus]|uniref:hypothetical protein n=1 Tax=Desulfonatronovibrio magnus TaxID=698827 RepID=UPI0005EB4DBA|nr:hypothetical protein [Desulfonatronovibrio magnus]
MNQNLSEKVRSFFLAKSAKESSRLSSDFDLLEMPVEAVMAYWLSIKKVLDTKGQAFLSTERDNTTEPFVHHLLGLLLSSLGPEKLERFGGIKKQSILRDFQRKFILMSISILGMSTNENPQKVLIRIISKFPISPIYERQVFDAAATVLKKMDEGSLNKDKFLNIDHRMKIESLIINLIIYNMLARRLGKRELGEYVQHIRSFYFVEGLSLIIDGFDYDFIKHRLNLQKKEILDLTESKMDMSLHMCSGIKSGLSYNDLHLVGSSYLF